MRKAPPAKEGHYELLESDYAEVELRTVMWLQAGSSYRMTAGHAPCNHDAIARQTLVRRRIDDISEELRMQFKSYVGRVVDAEALEGVKAEVLITMQELFPRHVIVVEPYAAQPDLLHVRAYHPTGEGSADQG